MEGDWKQTSSALMPWAQKGVVISPCFLQQVIRSYTCQFKVSLPKYGKAQNQKP